MNETERNETKRNERILRYPSWLFELWESLFFFFFFLVSLELFLFCFVLLCFVLPSCFVHFHALLFSSLFIDFFKFRFSVFRNFHYIPSM